MLQRLFHSMRTKFYSRDVTHSYALADADAEWVSKDLLKSKMTSFVRLEILKIHALQHTKTLLSMFMRLNVY